ncbi:MAG: class I SAM-dependent methyltransferase [archaeon]
MNREQKEGLIRELYEEYPYPSRIFASAKKLTHYSDWLAAIIFKKPSFWKGKKVLELGCGTGELSCSLALNGATVDAIDFSRTSIAKAHDLAKRFCQSNKPSFEVKNILLKKIPQIDSEKYDIVLALGSLHHTLDARHGFSIAAKHAKPDGVVIIGLYNKYSRFRHRLKRVVLRIFCGNDIKKRILLGKKLFGGPNNPAWLADKYGQVHESYHSISEVLNWFNDEEISFIASDPPFKTPLLDEIFWLIFEKNAFFVMSGRKKSSPKIIS